MSIRAKVREIVSEILEIEDEELIDDKAFTEYDFDSLLALDILTMLEKAFNTRLTESDLPKMGDVNSIVAMIEARKA